MSLLRCCRDWVQAEGGFLSAGNATDPQWVRIVARPSGVEPIYREIANVAGLSPSPRLLCVNSANGHIGLYIRHQDLIVLGLTDLKDLATHIFRAYFEPVSYPERLGRRVVSFENIWWAVIRITLAHEFGHALQEEDGHRGNGIQLEAGADHLAGQIAEALGWEPQLDRIVMDALGCREAFVFWSRPRPEGRVHAYDEGRQVVRERHRERLRQEKRRRAMEWFAGQPHHDGYFAYGR